MVWLEIEGLPLVAWGSNSFKHISSLWGKFMFFKDDQDVIVSCGRIYIGTKEYYFQDG